MTSGYAATATDTGHSTPGSTFAIGHPEKLIDYAHRSLHEMAVALEGRRQRSSMAARRKLALWNGCSTGGNQGLTIASKYPADFDAIVAGAPPDPRARLMSVRLLINRLVHRTPDSYIPPEKYPALHEAVLNACDTLDGAKDGVIENPRACKFDPKVLECKGADGASCLTPAQVETAKLIYSDVKFPKTERTLYPPLLQPGSELAWATLAGPQPFANAVDAYRSGPQGSGVGRPIASTWPRDFELMDEEARS